MPDQPTLPPTAPPLEDAAYEKRWTEYRAYVKAARDDGMESYDKGILTVSGGALALAFGFVKTTGHPPHKWLLITSWVLFGLSLLSTLASFRSSHRSFDNLLRQNRQLLQAGQVISPENYRSEAQKQPALPVRQIEQQSTQKEKLKLNERGKRIVARMDCPCGCEKKVHVCTCNTSNKIQKALASEDFKDKPDDEIIRALNKRFCAEGM